MRPQAAGGPTERAPTDLTGRGALLHTSAGKGPPAGSPGGGFTPAPLRDAQRNRASPTAKKRGDWSAGLRPASRGSAKPAPMRDAQRDRASPTAKKRGDWSAGLRPASRGSAKPAPLRDAQRDRASPTAKKRGDWSAGLRPASRGSAKPAPMTPRYANVSAAPSPSIGCRDRSPLLLSRLRPATVPIGVVCYNYDLYIQTEARYISVGEVDGVAVIVVAHTKRGGRIRLISARPASRKERQAWYEHLR